MEYKHSDTTKEIIAAAMEVHREIKSGFRELIYQRSLSIELNSRKIIFQEEVEMPIYYKGYEVGKRRVDFLVNKEVSVEIKAVAKLEDVHLAQALNYLESFNLEVGLLINFGSASLEVKRLYNKKYRSMIIQ